MKALTRGKGIEKQDLQEFIRNLDLPQSAKNELLKMTPASYTGIATKLAEKI